MKTIFLQLIWYADDCTFTQIHLSALLLNKGLDPKLIKTSERQV